MTKHVPLLFFLFFIAAAPGPSTDQRNAPETSLKPFTEEIKAVQLLEKQNLKFEMLPIKGGCFLFAVGKAAPKKVEIKSFWMAKTECTWDLYYVFWYQDDLPRNQRNLRVPPPERPDFFPLEHPDRGFGGLGFPVISTTPHAAEMYCRWLSQQTGRKYRLPTEAEWEYACRAGAKNPKLEKNQILETAWTIENADEQTQPVMKKKPNEWGLYDMLGNAGEWCTSDQGSAVLRGGWYSLSANKIHCGLRAPFDPQWNQRGVGLNSKYWLSEAPFAGFRVVRDE